MKTRTQQQTHRIARLPGVESHLDPPTEVPIPVLPVTAGLSDPPEENSSASGERRAHIVGVMCPDSGLDTDYFAAALAQTLVHSLTDGRESETPRVVLVDGSNGCGGVDVVSDCEGVIGPRWQSLRGIAADVDAVRLLQSLPARDGVAILAHTESAQWNPDDVVATQVVEALAGNADVIVLTLSPGQSWAGALAVCDRVIMLVRGNVGSLARAVQASSWLASVPLGLIVLEAPERHRVEIADALDAELIDVAPTRWHLSDTAADRVLTGRWPHEDDRVFRRLAASASRSVLAHSRRTS